VSQPLKRQVWTVVLFALLVVVPLTAILTAAPAHAGGSTCPPGTPPGYVDMCVAIGQPDLSTKTAGQPPSPTAIGNPTAVAFDPKGNLWVVDSSNNRVLEYAPPFTTGEAAMLVIGQTSLTGSGDSTPAGALFGPVGIAFDSGGNLWVVDSGNNRVLEFKSPFSNGELASLVIGQPTFGGYIGQTTSGGLNAPSYLAFDPSGNLWVTDQGNNRVLEFTTPFSTGEKATRVVGQEDFTSFSPSSTVTASSLFEPVGIAFDSTGGLWVVDSGDHRVLEYSTLAFAPPRPLDGASATMVIGQTSLTGSSTGLNAYGIAFDSSGNLWVSDGISGVAEYLAPLSTGETGTQVQDPKIASSPDDVLRDPQGIALDTANNLWVSDYSHGRVVVFGSGVVVTTSTSSSSSTTTGGGLPEFPYQLAIATVFTVLLAASYLLVRRPKAPGGPTGNDTPAGARRQLT
jgi:sugar lactone lactonase YvrE